MPGASRGLVSPGCRWGQSAAQMAEEMVHLFIPPWPVVVDVMAPDVDPGGNGLGPADRLKTAGIFQGLFIPGALADADHDRPPPVLLKKPRFNETSEVGQGGIKVYRWNIGSSQAELGAIETIEAAAADNSGKEAGMLEIKIDRMISPHAAAVGHRPDFRGSAMVADKGHHLSGHITIIVLVAAVAVGRRQVEIVPGFAVDAVDAEQLDPPAIDEGTNGADHAHSLIVEIAPPGTGEDDEGDPPVAVDLDGHLPAETGAVPAVFFSVHCRLPRFLEYRR